MTQAGLIGHSLPEPKSWTKQEDHNVLAIILSSEKALIRLYNGSYEETPHILQLPGFLSLPTLVLWPLPDSVNSPISPPYILFLPKLARDCVYCLLFFLKETTSWAYLHQKWSYYPIIIYLHICFSRSLSSLEEDAKSKSFIHLQPLSMEDVMSESWLMSDEEGNQNGTIGQWYKN